MRNTFLKDIRHDWMGSRILFGRNRVMQVALGRTPETAHRENLEKLTNYMSGDIGLLMTNEEPQVVRDYFTSFIKTDFARAGQISPLEFTVPEGIVYSRGGALAPEDDVPVFHSLETELRSLGMPTRLMNGKVVLSADYTICKKGQTLDSKQSRLLKQFGVAVAEFKVNLIAFYDREQATVSAEST